MPLSSWRYLPDDVPEDVADYVARATGLVPPDAPRAPLAPPPPSPAPAAPPRDAELEAAQERGGRNRFLERTGQGFDEAARAIAGLGPSPMRPSPDAGERPVRALLERRAAGEALALKDPTSPASRKLQEALAKTVPGLYSDDELRLVTAADKDAVLDVAKMRAELDARRAQAQAAANRAAVEAAQREADRRARGDEAEKQRRFTEKENSLNRDAAQRRAETMAESQKEGFERRQGAEAEKAARESNVYGRPLLPNATPTKEDAAKVKDSDRVAAQLKGALMDLRKAVQTAGPLDKLSPSASETLRSKYQLALDQYRNLAGLGVPSGPDTVLMDNALADPTKLFNVIAGKGTGSSLDNLVHAADRMSDTLAEVYGYGRRGAASGPARATGSLSLEQPPKDSAPSGKTTPGGKPYARKQYSASRDATRFLDDAGNVVEVASGRL